MHPVGSHRASQSWEEPKQPQESHELKASSLSCLFPPGRVPFPPAGLWDQSLALHTESMREMENQALVHQPVPWA